MVESTIKITCTGAAMTPLAKLEHFQGELKTLSEKEYIKLKKSIETEGFSFPVFAWKDKRGRLKIIDGHQRVQTVTKMCEDGYALPGGKLPVAWIDAKSEKDAKKKVLLAASQYGRYDEESVYRFIGEAGLDWPELKLEIDMPQVDMGKLEAGWFGDGELTEPDGSNPDPDDMSNHVSVHLKVDTDQWDSLRPKLLELAKEYDATLDVS